MPENSTFNDNFGRAQNEYDNRTDPRWEGDSKEYTGMTDQEVWEFYHQRPNPSDFEPDFDDR